MEQGRPCNLTMVSKNTLATVMAVYGWLKGRKCAILENRTTTVSTTDRPPTFGNPSTKSIVDGGAEAMDNLLRAFMACAMRSLQNLRLQGWRSWHEDTTLVHDETVHQCLGYARHALCNFLTLGEDI